MQGLSAFLRLIRWPNLVFIALTQVLFQYCILQPIFNTAGAPLLFSPVQLLLVTGASVLIAAAGNIINDYFDINIDRINKPAKLVIGKYVSRRWAILWHTIFSFAGVAISYYLGSKLGIWWMGPANFLCTFLLFVYSTTFKKKLLSGNIIISLLTAWSVAILGLACFYKVFTQQNFYPGLSSARIFRFTILYSAFAFIISLIREAIKDMEDIKGDTKYGCKTLPIVAGMNAAKIYSAVWLVVLAAALVIVQVYALQFGWWIAVVYCIFFIIAPLFYLLKQLKKASVATDYHKLSSTTKWIMLMGILSMIFFRIYL